jgi:hypothetical protein
LPNPVFFCKRLAARRAVISGEKEVLEKGVVCTITGRQGPEPQDAAMIRSKNRRIGAAVSPL